MPAAFERKASYRIEDLLRIMEILRSKEGCPWDREQDHHSIRKNFVEETYEACEAIDREDTDLLREELGDVLLQIVFHARMEFQGAEMCSLTGIGSSRRAKGRKRRPRRLEASARRFRR